MNSNKCLIQNICKTIKCNKHQTIFLNTIPLTNQINWLRKSKESNKGSKWKKVSLKMTRVSIPVLVPLLCLRINAWGIRAILIYTDMMIVKFSRKGRGRLLMQGNSTRKRLMQNERGLELINFLWVFFIIHRKIRLLLLLRKKLPGEGRLNNLAQLLDSKIKPIYPFKAERITWNNSH